MKSNIYVSQGEIQNKESTLREGGIELTLNTLGKMWVLEPKAFRKFLDRQTVKLSQDDMKLVSYHLSRHIDDLYHYYTMCGTMIFYLIEKVGKFTPQVALEDCIKTAAFVAFDSQRAIGKGRAQPKSTSIQDGLTPPSPRRTGSRSHRKQVSIEKSITKISIQT